MNFIKSVLKLPSAIKYFECDKKGSHQKQKLNLVCFNKQCAQNGLICNICKQDHQKHAQHVIPLKLFINQLTAFQKDQNFKKQQKPLQQLLQSLQRVKNMALYQLKVTVQKMAQLFRKMEENILASYQKAVIQLLQQANIKLGLDSLIDEICQNSTDNMNKYNNNIKSLINIITPTKRQSFTFKDKSKATIQNYQNEFMTKLNKLVQLVDFTQNLFNKQQSPIKNKPKRLNKSKIQSIKTRNDNEMFGNLFEDISDFQYEENNELDKKHDKFHKIKYTFSSIFKGQTLQVINGGLGARQTQNNKPGRYILVNEGMGLKYQKISFKITQLTNWIGLGICIKTQITNKNYQFRYQTIGHGAYIISSNGYSWSHSSKQDNLKGSDFKFIQGQTITITLSQNQIKFEKKNITQNFKLPLHIKPQQWGSVCFCVNLCSINDTVQILNE